MTKRRFPIMYQLLAGFMLVLVACAAVSGLTFYKYWTSMNQAEDVLEANVARALDAKTASAEFSRALLAMRGIVAYPDYSAYEKEYYENIGKSQKIIGTLVATDAHDDASRELRVTQELLKKKSLQEHRKL